MTASIVAASAGPGLGTKITVKLPLQVGGVPNLQLTTPIAKQAPVTKHLTGIKILVVDDEDDARQVAQVALATLGANVAVASSGREALVRLREQHFDVIVLDIGMPEMDGLSLLREIRSMPWGSPQDLPAVALSAFAVEADRRAGAEAGFQAYVAKPISLSNLSEGVGRAWRSAGAVRQ